MLTHWSESPGFTTTPKDWQQHVLKFEADMETATLNSRCFCICGCQDRGIIKYAFREQKMCIPCSRANTQRWNTVHRIAMIPADTFVSADDVMRQSEAREHTRATKAKTRLTTPYQVERVLAKRDREASKTRRADRKSEKAVSRVVDISQVSVGSYVITDERGQGITIRVERPNRGAWAGYSFVVVDPQHSQSRGGMQMPGAGEVYRGRYSDLVAQLPRSRVV